MGAAASAVCAGVLRLEGRAGQLRAAAAAASEGSPPRGAGMGLLCVTAFPRVGKPRCCERQRCCLAPAAWHRLPARSSRRSARVGSARPGVSASWEVAESQFPSWDSFLAACSGVNACCTLPCGFCGLAADLEGVSRTFFFNIDLKLRGGGRGLA